MKTFILTFLKHIKSFNNLFFNLTIKYVSSFNYIKSIMIYYSYFRYILEYFKAYRFYNLFKVLFKIIALINILLGLFTLIVFTDFRYDEYKKFIEYYITNLSYTDIFNKSKRFIKRGLKYILGLFDEDFSSPTEDKVKEKSPNNYNIDNKTTFNIDKNIINSDSCRATPYYCLLAFITVVICFKYPEYTVTPIISGITAFFTSLFGSSDTQGDKPSADILIEHSIP